MPSKVPTDLWSKKNEKDTLLSPSSGPPPYTRLRLDLSYNQLEVSRRPGVYWGAESCLKLFVVGVNSVQQCSEASRAMGYWVHYGAPTPPTKSTRCRPLSNSWGGFHIAHVLLSLRHSTGVRCGSWHEDGKVKLHGGRGLQVGHMVQRHDPIPT